MKEKHNLTVVTLIPKDVSGSNRPRRIHMIFADVDEPDPAKLPWDKLIPLLWEQGVLLLLHNDPASPKLAEIQSAINSVTEEITPEQFKMLVADMDPHHPTSAEHRQWMKKIWSGDQRGRLSIHRAIVLVSMKGKTKPELDYRFATIYRWERRQKVPLKVFGFFPHRMKRSDEHMQLVYAQLLKGLCPRRHGIVLTMVNEANSLKEIVAGANDAGIRKLIIFKRQSLI